MSKIRVYELAKELKLDNKEIMARLRTLKVPVKSHMSVVPDEYLDQIRSSPVLTETAASAGGVEEKRVAKGVIRRRARTAPAEPEPEEAPPKVDLATLKQVVKRSRRDNEEVAAKPEPEFLDEIPQEWTEEEKEEKAGRAKKKVAKKARPTPSSDEVEAPLPETTDEPSVVAGAAEEKTPVVPVTPVAPAEAGAPAAPADTPPRPRRIYIKPHLRRTARAPEGEPLPIPGQALPARGAEIVELPVEDDDSKKKKKKKKKGKAETVETPEGSEEAAPKKKLRRKVAFKVQRGIEGMEIADVERMYQPSRKKISAKKKVAKKTQITTPKAQKRIIRMGEQITVGELARSLGIKSQVIIRALAADGIEASENHALDYETAGVITANYQYEIVQELFNEEKVLGASTATKPAGMSPRPPVVTVMGHVDHGKTSLLDTIRKTRVTDTEAGAITQHIGASVVETSSGRICFVDTPGHEAFTAMRARGAKVTDLVVLVVAADDGIMPQTVEAANHAKAAGVPIIVAINKIDLGSANPQVVRQRLSEIELTPEDWGGETMVIDCSAKTGQGLPDLLEAILLQAEMLELKASPSAPGRGLVIESRLDKGKGPIATVVVQQGTLHRGDPILCGLFSGRIRAMLDDRGKAINEAGPSQPVEIMGLSGVPEPGELLQAVEDEKRAKLVAGHRDREIKKKLVQANPSKVSLEDLMARLEEGEVQSLNLILKTDTHGSAEAIRASVEKLSGPEVKVEVIHFGVGNVTENDVLLASASNAVVMGFMVKTEQKAQKLAENEGVQIRSYDIIYNLTDDVKASLKGMLKPVFEEKVIGKAEVRKVFRITKVGAVAGCYVSEGLIRRNARARLLRKGETVFTGRFKSLKRVQEDAREVSQGLECGIAIENFNDLQEGDIIEAYEITETAPA